MILSLTGQVSFMLEQTSGANPVIRGRVMSIWLFNSSACIALRNSSGYGDQTLGVQPAVEMWEAVLVIVSTGFLASVMAALFTHVRRVVYNDKGSLDTSFDAGGKVNAGLTATNIVSQWTWAATLLQSSTVASKYGISGPYWYAAGATIQLLLFSMLSVQLRIRAPGAKTFLQVIRARFGKATHKIFCVFALATNVIVTAMLMLGGAAVITSLVKYISLEFATILVAAVIGAYTFIGGVGAMFYVSYFNTIIIYLVVIIFIFKVYMSEDDPGNPLGSVERVFQYLNCAKGPDGNYENSYLTILSDSGLMFGLINIVGNFGTVFVDQSYWQSSVASKPRQGVLGFLFGGLSWFAIPFSLATTMGLAYIALSAAQGAPLLNNDDVNSGLVVPVVASRLLGKSGAMLILIIVLMAVTSTGSAEIMAVTSILIYDIYGVYLRVLNAYILALRNDAWEAVFKRSKINPYRRTTDTNSCLLCGKGRGRMSNPRDKCVCISMTYCTRCQQDDKNRDLNQRSVHVEYKCSTHGSYREYTDYLSRMKNWCLLWTTIAILPLTVLLYMAQLSLGWVYLFMGILVGSAVLPITLCMCWARLTGVSMMVGSVSGTLLAVVTWLCVASTYEGGLSLFLQNTGKEMSMLCGNLMAILGGGVITVVTTFITNRHYDTTRDREIWENTRDIDNPLAPWTELYAKELNLTGVHHLDNRPSLDEVSATFRSAQTLSKLGSLSLTFLTIVLWPAGMVALKSMTLKDFSGWVDLSKAWAFLALMFVLVVPLVNEVWDVTQAFHVRHKVSCQRDVLIPEPTVMEPQCVPHMHVPHNSSRTNPDNRFNTLPVNGSAHFVRVTAPETHSVSGNRGYHDIRANTEPDVPMGGSSLRDSLTSADDLSNPVF